MTNSKRGKFIVFEGADCVGKTTQMDLLGLDLYDEYNIVKVEEITPALRKEIEEAKGLFDDRTDFDAYITLLFAKRRQMFIHGNKYGVEDMLDKGITVLCSRYKPSSFAYQFNKLSLDIGKIFPEPDLYIFLKAEKWEIESRLKKRLEHDVFEKDLEFQMDVQERLDDYFLIHTNVPVLGYDTTLLDADTINKMIYRGVLNHL